MLPSHYSGYACYLLPSSLSTGERVSLATVFSTMHTHSSDMGITDWGIGQVGGLCVWGKGACLRCGADLAQHVQCEPCDR